MATTAVIGCHLTKLPRTCRALSVGTMSSSARANCTPSLNVSRCHAISSSHVRTPVSNRSSICVIPVSLMSTSSGNKASGVMGTDRHAGGEEVSYASVNLCVRKVCSYRCRCRVTSLPHVIKHGSICLLRNLSLTRWVKAIYAVTA